MSEELEAFVGNEATETVVETAETQTVETPAEIAPVEAGQTDNAPKVENEGEPTTPTTETMIPLAAKQAEKERRKQAERERDDLRLELARRDGYQQANQQKKEPDVIPDAYSQPEEYTQYQLKQAETRRNNESQNALMRRLSSAEEVARSEIPDYDEVAKYFAEKVAPGNAEMIENMKAAPDPAKYAYIKGKQAMKAAEAQSVINDSGGLDAYEAKIREKVLAEMKAQEPDTPNIPPDLTGARNAGSDPKGGNIDDGTAGLHQLLGR